MGIGERIKERRELLNMSQDELAKKLGYKSRSSIQKIEIGERDLRPSKIKQIADALQTTPSYIMGWCDLDGNPLDDPPSVDFGSMLAERYGDHALLLLSNFEKLDEADQDELAKWVGEFCKLDGRDRVKALDRIYQIVGDLLKNEKYAPLYKKSAT